MRIGSLCTGYGGIEMGLTLAGERTDLRWIAETNTALAAIHSAPNLGDLRSVDWSAVEPVDLLTAGFPCQPVSAAGRQRGRADDRWLWPEVARAVGELAPVRVLLENVRNLISLHKGELWVGILGDLAGLGYDVRWLTLGACRVGMAHHRHRMFALATRAPANRPALPAERLAVAECGLKAPLIGLPTPAARDGDGRGEGDREYWSKRAETRTNGMPLGAAVALLPTPTERDNTRHGGGIGHGTTGGSNLRTVAAWELMPTPRATVDAIGGPNQRGRRGDLAVPSAVQPERWGRFVDGRAPGVHSRSRAPRADRAEPQRGAPPVSRVRGVADGDSGRPRHGRARPQRCAHGRR